MKDDNPRWGKFQISNPALWLHKNTSSIKKNSYAVVGVHLSRYNWLNAFTNHPGDKKAKDKIPNP